MLTTAFNLTVTEPDGSPSVAGVRILRFTNGTVTDDGGGQVSITIAAGSPGGSSGDLQYNSGGSFAGLAMSAVATSGDIITLTSAAAADIPIVTVAHASQSGALQEWRNSGGTPKARITKEGSLYIKATSGIYAIEVIHASSGAQIFRIDPVASGVYSSGPYITDGGFTISAYGAYLGVNGGQRFIFNADSLDYYSGTTYGRMSYFILSSTSTNRETFQVAQEWATSTDASRKSRAILNIYDTAAREAIRLEASGSAAMLGFYGATAAVRQADLSGLATIGLVAAATLPTASLTNVGASLRIASSKLETGGTLTTATDGATVTFDLSVSNRQTVTLGGNRILALSGDADGVSFVIILKQDGGGSRTVTWWSGIKWPGGTVPTLTTTGGKQDVFTFTRLASGEYLGWASLNH